MEEGKERKTNKKIFKNFFILIFVLIILFSVYNIGVLVGRRELSFTDFKLQILKNQQNPDIDFSLLWDVLKSIEEEYPGSIDYQKILYNTVNGALEGLDDPYSYFMTEEEGRMLLEETEGYFGGIGAEVGVKNDNFQIMSVLEDTPAQKAGLLAGDIILRVDGEDISGMNLYEVVKKIRGTPKTQVKLTIQREGWSKPKDFTIERDIIVIKTVKYELKNNNIAYIKIIQFSQNTFQELSDAVNFFKDKKIKGIILDLRDNPGGELDVVVDVASLFLNKKPVLIEKMKGEKTTTLYTSKPTIFKDEPVVVLVNNGTASAAEILAGAIRDNKRGILIGEKTFGKGSVQKVEKIRGGYLRLTIAFWLTPSGKSINKEGLDPDIKVEMSENDIKNKNDLQLKKAIEYLIKD